MCQFWPFLYLRVWPRISKKSDEVEGEKVFFPDVWALRRLDLKDAFGVVSSRSMAGCSKFLKFIIYSQPSNWKSAVLESYLIWHE